MKNFRKLMTVSLTIIMVFVLSANVFAASNHVDNNAKYTLKVFADPIVEGTSEITVGFGIVDATGDDIELVGNADSEIVISCNFPNGVAGFVSDEVENKLDGVTIVDENTYTDNYEGVDYFSYKVKIPAGTNFTITPDTIICAVKLKLVDNITEGTYKFTHDEHASSIAGHNATYKTVLTNYLAQPEEFDGFKVVAATPVEPEAPVIENTKDEKGASVEKDNVVYTNIYNLAYTAKAASNVGISEIGIKYHKSDVNAADALKINKPVDISGGATVTFKAAILGVAKDTPIVVEPYTVYDFVK